jgi:hypothetical protein
MIGDPQMLAGAVTFATGLITGVVVRSLPAHRREPKPPPVPLCQCDHPRALHDSATNECHQQVQRWSTARGTFHEPCPCRQHVGPEPLPSMFHPGIELPPA